MAGVEAMGEEARSLWEGMDAFNGFFAQQDPEDFVETAMSYFEE